jgi:hypothetical protein
MMDKSNRGTQIIIKRGDAVKREVGASVQEMSRNIADMVKLT